jgi:hypothetical protein
VEQLFVDLFSGIGILPGDIEIFGHARSVMCLDKVDNLLRQVIFLCNLHPILHVVDNDPGTLFKRESRMRIHSGRLILGKEGGIDHFPDIVIERTGSYQGGIGSDFHCGGHAQVGDLQRMLKSSRSLFR